MTAATEANSATERPGAGLEPTLVLMYHAVHPTEEHWNAQKKAGRLYAVGAEQFERQMEFLAREGYKALSLDEFLAGTDEARSVIITFDDGHLSNLTVSLPILQRYRLQAEFFVTIDFVGRPRFMTWEQIRELQSAGMSIQSHGLYHQPLTGVPEGQLQDELRTARERIEENTGRPVKYLAIPGGFADERVYREAFAAGYSAVCNSEPGVARIGKIVPRVAVMRSTSQHLFEKLVRRDALPLFRLQARRKLGQTAKALFGSERYELLKTKALHRG